MRQGVFGPHDALDLLYKAATDRFVMPSSVALGTANGQSSPAADTHRRQPSMASIAAGRPQPAQAVDEPNVRARSRGPSMSVRPEQQPVDPNLDRPTLSAQPGYEDALRAWSRFRFVRAGWFTAQEAIEYID